MLVFENRIFMKIGSRHLLDSRDMLASFITSGYSWTYLVSISLKKEPIRMLYPGMALQQTIGSGHPITALTLVAQLSIITK